MVTDADEVLRSAPWDRRPMVKNGDDRVAVYFRFAGSGCIGLDGASAAP